MDEKVSNSLPLIHIVLIKWLSNFQEKLSDFDRKEGFKTNLEEG